MNKILGLTGNIGSGKTSVGRFFELIGWPVFNSDLSAKTILSQNLRVKKQLIDTFGNGILHSNSSINNLKLAELGLDQQNVQVLNSIIHPEVKNMFEKWMQKQHAPFVVRESALLFEANIEHESFKNIVVVCPLEERIKRAVKRGGISEESIRKRELLQWPQEKKIALSDYCVDNYQKAVLPQLVHLKQTLENQLRLGS